MISAVIITYNEARNIARCLQSLQGVADEVIVVDSMSEDETPAICAEYGVKFISQEWQGYAKAKNTGNSLATHPYILSIDADEALSPALRENLLAVKEELSDIAYSFPRRNYYCGQAIRYGGWYPDTKIRLFPQSKGEWTGDFVHETLQINSETVVKKLTGDLLHYTCYTIGEHVERINRYSSLAAGSLFARGKKASLFRLLLSPTVRFLQIYFLKLGFLDGFNGYIIAKLSAKATFLRYAKLRSKWKNPSNTDA